MAAPKNKDVTRLAILFTVCGVLLLTIAIGGLVLRCRTLETRLNGMLLQSMTSHTEVSGTEAKRLIDDTQALLEEAARLLGDGVPPDLPDDSLVNLVLEPLGLGRGLEISFLNWEELDSVEPGSEEQRVYQQLQPGSCVVGSVIPAQDEFYFLVVRPITDQGGKIVGAVQAKASADLLSNQGHDSSLFLSVQRVLAADDGHIVCGSSPELRGLSLTELVRGDGLDQKGLDRFAAAYHANEYGSLSYETKGGQGYVAWAPISYNGWRVVQISQSPDLQVERTSLMQTVVMVVSLLVCAALAALIWRMRSRMAADKLRYSALSEFKDTLIFEYDCQKDSLEFTSNALDTLDLDDVRLEEITDLKHDFPVFHPDDLETVRRVLWEAETLVQDQVAHDRIRLKRKNGEYSWYRSQYKAVFDEKGKVIRLIGTLTDISAQINQEMELRKQAQQDPLTGVYNRAGVKLINARLEQISRGVLFMLDMDDFKRVNDTFGHAAGDRLLMAIGGVLRDTFRTDDIVARIGGDEFIAFLSGSDSRATAEAKGQELLERVRNLRVEGVEGPITVSVGAASAPAQGRTYETLSLAADEAMYHVKQNGKGGFSLR